MNYKTLKTEFERELLIMLIISLRRKKISNDRAKQISKEFLSTIKSSDNNKEMLNNISKLCASFPEIVDAYLKVAKKHEDVTVKEKLSGLSFYLKVGQVDEALSVLKTN